MLTLDADNIESSATVGTFVRTLRVPLKAVLAQVPVLRGPRTPLEVPPVIERVVREVFAGSGLEVPPPELRPIELDRLTALLVAQRSPNEVRRIEYLVDEPLVVAADPARLAIALTSLLDTALHESSPIVPITVHVARSAPNVVVSVLVAGEAHPALRTALGVARGIIAAHGGRVIGVELDDARLLCVELPEVREETGPPRVLVVDDDEGQRLAIAEVLRAEGIATETASTGGGALSRLARGERFSVLVVDVRLPDMNGVEVLQLGREVVPDLRAVVISGYPASHPLIASAANGRRYRYVPKPLNVRALLAAIRELLAA